MYFTQGQSVEDLPRDGMMYPELTVAGGRAVFRLITTKSEMDGLQMLCVRAVEKAGINVYEVLQQTSPFFRDII